MTSRNRLILLVVALLVVLGGGYFLLKQRADVVSGPAPVLIAANLPLSGPLATYGTAVREGATLALEEHASDPGPKIAFDWQDNAGDPKTTFNIFQKQLLDRPTIYTSGVKPQTAAIADQVAAAGLPHFVWIFDVNINSSTKNNLRTWVNFKIDAPLYVNYAVRNKSKKVSVIYVNLPITVEEYEKLVVPGLKAAGITDLQIQVYEAGQSDFKNLAAKVKRFAPDTVILCGFQTDLVGLVRALRPLGVIKDGNTIASYDMLDAAAVLGPDEIEGIRVTAPYFSTRPGAPAVASFTRSFKAKYGKAPLYTDAFAYDMVTVVKDAARRLGPDAAKAKSDAWIAAIRSTKTPGVTGDLAFDKDGDLITPIEVGVYRSGKLVPDVVGH